MQMKRYLIERHIPGGGGQVRSPAGFRPSLCSAPTLRQTKFGGRIGTACSDL